MNLNLKNLIAGALLASSILVAGCASHKAASEADSTGISLITISGADLKDENGQAILSIKSTAEPKYNVFKLTDPEKIVVDVMDAKLADDVVTSIPGKETVQEVKVQGLEDSLSSIVRFEIFVKNGANYVAGIDNGTLSVRILGVAGAGNTPVSAASPSPDKIEGAPAETPAAVAAPLDSPANGAGPEASVDANTAKPEVLAEAPAAVPAPELPDVAPPAVPEKSVEKANETPDFLNKDEMPKAEASSAPSLPPAAPELAPDQVGIAPLPPELPKEAEAVKTPEAEIAPAPEPLAEDSLKTKKNKKSHGNENAKALHRIENQDIPNSGLTEGTSLLTELDTKVYTGKRVSLEFQDADVQDILRLIADVSKLNIITSDDVKGNLTLKLIDVPWDQALDIVLTTLGLDKVQHGNIIRVAQAEKLKKEREVALANDKAAKQLEPLRLKLINVNYATAEEMASRIKNLLSERGTVDTDTRTNTLIVKDIREHLSRIENLIKALDTQTPQVRIEARIVEAQDTFQKSLGIQWGPALALDDSVNGKGRGITFPHNIDFNSAVGSFPAPAAQQLGSFAVDALPGNTKTGGDIGFRLGSISNIFNLDLHLSYAENNSEVRIVSRPSISVLDNRTARIIQGTKIPFLSSGSAGTNVQFQDAGIEINVTPQITSDGSVVMKLSTKSNEPGSTSVGGNVSITIREAQTEMLVKSGRTAVLGGVFKTNDTQGDGGVPGLMDIPVIGWLFKGKSSSLNREETLVFITPYILNDSRTASTTPAAASELEP